MPILHEITGSWHVQYTNFPMWLKGDKLYPQFYYKVETKRGKTGLVDTVKYIQQERERTIKGFDYPQNKENTQFIWKNSGWFEILQSKWDIVYMDDTQEWMAIHFSKTLFTPEGFDIITRKEVLDTALQQEIENWLNASTLPQLQKVGRNSEH